MGIISIVKDVNSSDFFFFFDEMEDFIKKRINYKRRNYKQASTEYHTKKGGSNLEWLH